MTLIIETAIAIGVVVVVVSFLAIAVCILAVRPTRKGQR
jgi:hypothetical protein